MTNSRKRVFGLTIIILVILAGISVLIIVKHDHSDKTIYVDHINVPFRSDGRLEFISPNRNDTLAVIEIQIVKSDEEITRGLMDRDSMLPNRGMLFIFSNEAQRTFWMKNTRFSLDIIFIDHEKTIRYIADHTTPYSENPIPGFYPALYVLEVNAGFCEKNGITPGTLIDFQ